jgi:glycosyltransferase involved in cell wall biosynthesis
MIPARVYLVENDIPTFDATGGIKSYMLNLSRYLKGEGVETWFLGCGPLPEGETPFSGYIRVCRRKDASNFEYLRGLLKKQLFRPLERDALVHAQRPDMLFPFTRFGRRATRVCSLHGAHDKAVFDKKNRALGRIYTALQRAAFRKADLLIAVDRATRDYYLEKYPRLEGRIEVVPIGIDMDRFRPMDRAAQRRKHGFAPEEQVVMSVGRLEKEKNLELLLRAFARLRTRLASARLELVGEGRGREALEAMVSRERIPAVHFRGRIANRDVPELLNCADVFALTSDYEGSPNSIKEALACDVPVVSVPAGDAVEVLRDIEGCRVAGRDPGEFAEALAAVLTGAGRFQSREKMRPFCLEAVGEKTLELYRRALAGRGAGD